MPTAAQIVARRLADAGVRHAFGIPGGEVLTLMQALDQAGIRIHLCKHEGAGGFMAEGLHYMTGGPAVLFATLGPGAANAANAIVNAEQERVPLIFLTGCMDPADAVTYTHQVFDHSAMFSPVTRASFLLQDGAVEHQMDKAIAIAMDDPKGPVHIDLTVKLAGKEQGDVRRVRRVDPSPAMPAPGPDLDRARAWLGEARRPLAILGHEVMHHGAGDAVRRLVETHAIPTVMTYKAKGVLPEDHPLSLGGAGLSPKADDLLFPLIRESDLLLLIGYDPIETRLGWVEAWDPRAKRVVEFRAVVNHHYVHQTSISFVGNVRCGVEALMDGVRPGPTWAGDRGAALRAELKSTFAPKLPWGPCAVVHTVRKLMPRDTVATADSGSHRILVSQAWECYHPYGLLHSTGLGSMGTALPLAIGAKTAQPSRPVVAFTGDGGMDMVLGELATLRDSGLPVLVVVFVDHYLSLIRLKQRQRQLPEVGVGFGETDFAAVARAMGGNGFTVQSIAELEAAVTTALASDRFTLVAAKVDPSEYDNFM